MDANHIGESHSVYYMAYAKHMESRSKVKIDKDIFNLGIARTLDKKKLAEAYKKFLVLSMRRPKVMDKDLTENHLSARSLGIILARGEGNRHIIRITDGVRKKCKPIRSIIYAVEKFIF
ncbi:hypothetical protein RJ641_032511 [Dillenia turbinata]|uniref:Uncharacterized protein n=1 Tax=Dillenia turbinata TaxID=194707 RepID=A0AAN8ZLW3_9MAGN